MYRAGGDEGKGVFRKNEDYLNFIFTAPTEFGGDRQRSQYYPIQLGQRWCREGEGEDGTRDFFLTHVIESLTIPMKPGGFLSIRPGVDQGVSRSTCV